MSEMGSVDKRGSSGEDLAEPGSGDRQAPGSADGGERRVVFLGPTGQETQRSASEIDDAWQHNQSGSSTG